MNKIFQSILTLIEESLHLTEEEKKLVVKSVMDADKVLEITAFKLDRTEKVKRTMAIVLEETIEELEQKRKAVEEQNKELEIEAATERVRMQSMAMQHPSDFEKVNKELLHQLTKLKIDGLSGVSFYFIDDDEIVTVWDLSSPGSMSDPNSYSFKYDSKKYPVLGGFVEILKTTQEDYFILDFPKPRLLQGIEELKEINITIAEAAKNAVESGALSHQWNPAARITDGILSIDLMKPPDDDTKTILLKMAGAFNQAYTRFLDLQKAEAQAREAHIETALEKVRSRTMAMQKSEELSEVSYLLNKQVVELGIPTWGCAFNIYNENDSTEWFSSLEITIPAYHTPRENIFLKYYEAGQRGESLLIEEFGGERIKELYKYFATLNDSGDETINNHVANAPNYQINHMAYFKYGYLLFITPEPAPEAHDVFKRFAKVFEQTYTRFLDLQKAEAQAREAEIEAALERVRSRTMAMQKSDELTEVAGILFKQVTDMGIKLWTAGFNVWSEDNNSYVDYITSPFGGFIEPYTVYTDTAEALTDVSNARKSGVEFDVQYVEGEKLKQLYLAIGKLDEKQFEIMLEEGIWIHSHQYEHFVFGSKVSLMFITYEPVPEAHDIFKRFGKVFEQSYTRFLDLQKAEAQAREAQIEAALERVRSRTMAMQHSKELAETASLLFKQVIDLGVNAFAITFQFWLEDGISTTCWTSVGDGMQPSFRIPHTEEPFHHQIYKAWKKGEDFFVMETEGEELEDVYRYVAMQMDEEVRNIMENSEFSIPKFQVVHCVFFLQGYIMFMTYERTPEAHDIFKRFGKVFEQSYTRFLDLQKAEAQARDAQIETALERIRSRTMAMQKSDELREAANLLSHEVRGLGIPVWSCGYNIMEKAGKSCIGWMSTEGSIQPSFRIPLEVSPTFIRFYESRQKEEVFYEEQIGGADLKKHYDYMLTLSDFYESHKLFLETGHQLPTFQVNNVVNFTKGNLIFITAQPVPQAWDIFKRFATVFEQTYTRFLDLKQAEEQAREAQIEASFERIRSRAMAMDTSDELNALIGFVYSECSRLDMNLDRSLIMTFDKVTNDTRWWMAGPEASDVAMSYLVKYHEYVPSLAFLKGWHDREQKWSYLYEGENKKNWDKYCFEETGLVEMPEPMKAGMRAQKSIILNASFQNFGCVILSTHEPMSDEHFDLLVRLSKVFDLAYTRFLDLQLKEQNALKLIEEKQKLEQTLTELRVTQTQLIQKEKLASLGELTAGIAHEIQNPLNFVNNFSELSVDLAKDLNEELEKPDIDKTYVAELLSDLTSNQEKINHHGKRASNIVKGMLEHSRASTGVKELTDINKLADEYLRLAYHGLRAKDKDFNANYELIIDENLHKIEVIPQDIGRVLLNLINNAFYAVNQKRVKNTEGGYQPTVIVSTEQLDNQIIIKVKDNGTGMPESVRAKVFQPFFTTKPTGSGTGLGLSLAYDIVTKGHGGALEVTSTEGVGTEFIITLPFKTNEK